MSFNVIKRIKSCLQLGESRSNTKESLSIARTDVHRDARHHPGLKQNLSSFSKHTAPPNKQKAVLEYVNFIDLIAKEAEIRPVLRLWLYLLLPILPQLGGEGKGGHMICTHDPGTSPKQSHKFHPISLL
jgi:hypothetical protein